MEKNVKNLKPCPFCGDEAEIKKIFQPFGMDGGYEDWHIYCNGCYANMELPADNFYGRKPMTKEEAINTWNKRIN